MEFKAIDLRKIWNKNITLFNDKDFDRLDAILKNYNTKVAVITGPFAKCSLPDLKFKTTQKKIFQEILKIT